MLGTPRHEFIAERYRAQAYFDRSLPIGGEQTISSPFIVAYMTQALDPQPTDLVLEIGTGSGYQAAVLSPLVRHVYTIEIVESLGRHAQETLSRLNYKNVSVSVGDGYLGWPQAAPFDKIIVTCSPEKVPEPLQEQLREGGRMAIPVGERYQQMLHLFEKRNGQLVLLSKQPTLFVPMTGAAESVRVLQPDGKNPQIINGDFEAKRDTHVTGVPGWYYARGVTLEQDSSHQGTIARFENHVPGQPSVLLQGFAIDGRSVARVRCAATVQTQEIKQGLAADEIPAVLLTFYNENRQEVGSQWLGPFLTRITWKEFADVFTVPPSAREAILRIGLFGATGRIDFDNLRLEVLP
jgi:protein-L-isoaspartate(D-aspartate) O-methyltransferase